MTDLLPAISSVANIISSGKRIRAVFPRGNQLQRILAKEGFHDLLSRIKSGYLRSFTIYFFTFIRLVGFLGFTSAGSLLWLPFFAGTESG